MTIIASELFDAGTTGATITETAPWTYQLGTSGIASTYQPLAAAHGATGMRITDISKQNDVRYDNTTAIASFCLSFYFNIRTAPGANAYIGQLNDVSNVKVGDFRINATTMTVTLRNAGSSAVGGSPSAAVLSLNTWYRVEYLATATARELKIFAGESTTALIDLTDTSAANTCRYGFAGNLAASASGGAIDIDTIRIADTFPGPYAAGGGGGGGPATVLATENFDSGTDGTSVAESAPWAYLLGASGTHGIYATAAADHGARGMRVTDLAHQNTVKYDNTSAIATMCDSFYFNIRTTVGAATYIAAFNDSTNTKVCDLRLNTDLTVTIRNGVTGVDTSTATLSTGTWYRLEYVLTASGQEAKVFLGESTTTLFDLVGATNGNTARYAYAGNVAAAGTGAIDFDTVRIATGFIGPFTTTSRLPYKGQKITGVGTSTPVYLNRKDA